MSDEKEVGVFCTGLAITKEGISKYQETQEFFLGPALYELLHKTQDSINAEGIYKFTLSVTKLK